MQILPEWLHGALDYITSPGIVVPTLVLMILVIYYLMSTSGLLREANDDLKEQVIKYCIIYLALKCIIFAKKM